MKKIITLFALLIPFLSIAQRNIPPTDGIKISGEIKHDVYFTLADLDTFPKSTINDVIIYNHNGEIKDTLNGMKGIPIKTLLAPVLFNYEKPKFLNEFYFVFKASDGYKVVFSWNEIYNTETGNRFYIVTEMENKKLALIDQRIIFISTGDLKAGRRYIKGLAEIKVKRED